MPDSDIQGDILALLQQQSISCDPITIESALYHDLRLYGDDAHEILTELSKRYGVSFSGFNFSTYFPNEGLLAPFLPLRAPENWRRLTVGHLLAVIDRQQWFEP
jgi:Protein of unknown function (DUF1493)